MEEFLHKFSSYNSFPLDSVEFLDKPSDFYSRVLIELENCNEAFMCSLVFGTDENCDRILEIIHKRKKNKQKTLVIIDKNRVKRSKNLVQRLKHYDIEDVFVFVHKSQAPIIPPIINELIGVLHMKLYLFDKSIILTGANLEGRYFTNRIDRYIVIQNQELSDELYNACFSTHDPQFTQKKVTKSFSGLYTENDSFIIPFDGKSESDILEKIFENEYRKIYLSTAYINFTEKHLRIFENKNLNLIIPDPDANTFKSDFISGKYIIELYLLNTKNALKALPDLQLYEYIKPLTTFHSKGLWCYHDNYTVTIIGSTNFNYRSLHRDIEYNFMIVTKNKTTKEGLVRELNEILRHTKEVNRGEILGRYVSVWSRLSHTIAHRLM